MYIIKIVSLAIICLFNFSSFSAESAQIKPKEDLSFIKILKYSEILDDLDDSTLILLDLDNTIIRSDKDYGSVEFFLALLQEAKKNGLDSKQALLESYERWFRAQKHITVELIDKEIANFISKANNSGSQIIIITGRNPTPEIIDLTFKQLNLHKLSFSQLPNMEFEQAYESSPFMQPRWCAKDQYRCHQLIEEFTNPKAKFFKGVLFAHLLNPKGMVLKDFYQTLAQYNKNIGRKTIKKILFIDDYLLQLESVKEAVHALGLEFKGYHMYNPKHNFSLINALNEEKKYN
jgi:hypothetical protein